MAKKSASQTATPKQATPTPAAKSPSHTSSGSVSATTPSRPHTSTTTLTSRSSAQDVALHVWQKYLNETPARTMLLDVFMLFLVLVGAVQFVYCIIGGNYPFNAFLSGFGAATGQFVLTASLRMQTTERSPSTASTAAKKASNKDTDVVSLSSTEEGKSKISSERAFADYVLGSLILHAFCVNFIN